MLPRCCKSIEEDGIVIDNNMTDKRTSLPVNYGSNAVENVDVIDHIDIDREQVFIGEDEET